MTSTDAAAPASSLPARWQDYVALLKPRVMSLVVFTAATGLACSKAPINPILGAIAILSIAVGAGASGALNMWYDADIDQTMKRTKNRPVPSGRVQPSDALGLGITLSLLSVGMMALATNILAAGLLTFTILFYAIVYTMWLKRSTPQNIVIGGLAGALPPVIGWAAASGTTPLNAWLLCAIIFLWTPPHFWALSLYTTTDYAKAGVPMMPVVRGPKSTRRQILAYSFLLVAAAVAPAFTGLGGALYLGVSGLGGVAFIVLAALLALSHAGEAPDEARGLYDVKAQAKTARNLFAYSIGYLFAMFAALLVERLAGLPPLHL